MSLSFLLVLCNIAHENTIKKWVTEVTHFLIIHPFCFGILILFLLSVLLLPWYSYIGCWWISRPSVANPSIPFFREFPLIVSERIDAGKVLEKNTFVRTESSNVEAFLESYDVKLLKESGISHILFLKYCYKSDETLEYLDILSELWEINPILTKEMIDIYIIP